MLFWSLLLIMLIGVNFNHESPTTKLKKIPHACHFFLKAYIHFASLSHSILAIFVVTFNVMRF